MFQDLQPIQLMEVSEQKRLKILKAFQLSEGVKSCLRQCRTKVNTPRQISYEKVLHAKISFDKFRFKREQLLRVPSLLNANHSQTIRLLRNWKLLKRFVRITLWKSKRMIGLTCSICRRYQRLLIVISKSWLLSTTIHGVMTSPAKQTMTHQPQNHLTPSQWLNWNIRQNRCNKSWFETSPKHASRLLLKSKLLRLNNYLVTTNIWNLCVQ